MRDVQILLEGCLHVKKMGVSPGASIIDSEYLENIETITEDFKTDYTKIYASYHNIGNQETQTSINTIYGNQMALADNILELIQEIKKSDD